MPALSEWESFYVIVGSSAGALIGLQFVVITLINESPAVKDLQRASSAFITPTIVHFGAVLLVSAAISAPWEGIAAASLLWGVLGVAGMLYVSFVSRRVHAQKTYSPQFEDVLCHVLLPFAAYAALSGSALAARVDASWTLFAVGAAALLLLFTGIHNAWDTVTYHVFVVKKKQQHAEKRH
jgi:hypothetical protein